MWREGLMGWLLEILQRYSVREQVKNDQAHEGGQVGEGMG